MQPRRLVALAMLAGLVFGSLIVTCGYAWYLRSDNYRNFCAQTLSESLGLPAEIGQVVPRSRRSREFEQVRVWLPERRGQAAFCQRAVLTYTPTDADPDAYELVLSGGQCEVSTRTWLREDYRAVLESGLRPGFDPDGPRRVVFTDMSLAFDRDRFRATLGDAAGVVSFEDEHTGRARVTCDTFNGFHPGKPVTLDAEFSPQASGVQLDRVELNVPELPIESVGLADLAGLGLRTGSFSGRVVYRETEAGRELTVHGRAFRILLSECTAAFFARPWHGSAQEVELEELDVLNGRPTRVRFRGVFRDAVLGDILAPWHLDDVGGDLVLRVHAAEVSTAGIERLVASGRCDDLSLERLTVAVGWGGMTGKAQIVIDDLSIIDNRLVGLDASIIVRPTDGEPNWIERKLLSEVLTRAVGLSLPEFLPERFEYARFGLHLEVRDEVLYVFGTHGPREKAILSVALGDQEMPVVPEPEEPIDLRPLLDDLRARLAAHVTERLRRLSPANAWRALSIPRSRPVLSPGRSEPE